MKLSIRQLKTLIRESVHRGIESFSDEDALGTTQPKHSYGDPKELLLKKLIAASQLKTKFAGLEPEEIAQKLGLESDPEMLDLISQMIQSPLYR